MGGWDKERVVRKGYRSGSQRPRAAKPRPFLFTPSVLPLGGTLVAITRCRQRVMAIRATRGGALCLRALGGMISPSCATQARLSDSLRAERPLVTLANRSHPARWCESPRPFVPPQMRPFHQTRGAAKSWLRSHIITPNSAWKGTLSVKSTSNPWL